MHQKKNVESEEKEREENPLVLEDDFPSATPLIIKDFETIFFVSVSYADIIKITQCSRFPNENCYLFVYSLRLSL